MTEKPVYERNIEVMKDRYSDVVKYLELPGFQKSSFAEEEDLNVGVQDVGGKAVMCAQKGDRTYRLDSLYDSSVMLDWLQ